MGDMCYYRMDMKVKLNSRIDSSSTTKDNLDVMLSNGTLSSENCEVYMDIAATFEEKDLRSFFSKASDYAISMASISTFQIYLLLTQLQYSGTQAMAAKVSLLTIGLQAIVDSYLCLFHLTAGIIAQVCTFVHVLQQTLIFYHSLSFRPFRRLPFSSSLFSRYLKCDICSRFGKPDARKVFPMAGLSCAENSRRYIHVFTALCCVVFSFPIMDGYVCTRRL